MEPANDDLGLDVLIAEKTEHLSRLENGLKDVKSLVNKYTGIENKITAGGIDVSEKSLEWGVETTLSDVGVWKSAALLTVSAAKSAKAIIIRFATFALRQLL